MGQATIDRLRNDGWDIKPTVTAGGKDAVKLTFTWEIEQVVLADVDVEGLLKRLDRAWSQLVTAEVHAAVLTRRPTMTSQFPQDMTDAVEHTDTDDAPCSYGEALNKVTDTETLRAAIAYAMHEQNLKHTEIDVIKVRSYLWSVVAPNDELLPRNLQRKPGELLLDTHEVVGGEQPHDLDMTCWCQPEVTYTDPLTGAKVISHKVVTQ